MNVEPHYTSSQLLKMYKVQSNHRIARRIHGVYLAQKGGGIEALKDKPRPGKPTTLPRRMEKRFCRRIAQGPSKQDGVSVLNGPAIKHLLEREFGVVYSLWGVYDLLHRLGYSCLCPRPQHENTDPKAHAEFKKTCPRSWIKSNQSIQTKK